MNNQDNYSQMLLDISGNLLDVAPNSQEMQSRVNMLVTGWNMALHSKSERQLKMKRFIRKLKSSAPTKEALKAFEGEIKRIIKHKLNLYPDIETPIEKAEVVTQASGLYELKAYFKDKDEEAKQQRAQYTITRLNQTMSKA